MHGLRTLHRKVSNFPNNTSLILIASPLIALYGLAPVYLNTTLTVSHLAVSFVSLTLMIMFFWRGNQLLFHTLLRLPVKYGISYCVSFGLHVFILLFMPLVDENISRVNLIAYALISTLAINTILLIIINAQQLKVKKESVEMALQKSFVENLEAQKRALQQQLQPHFLFNALSILKSLTREDPAGAEEYTIKLSEFLRYSVQSSGKEIVTLKEECRFTLDYLSLQQKRYGSALKYEFDLPEQWMEAKIVVFALQALVENALKHNRFTEKHPLYINIDAQGDRIRVQNNKAPKALLISSGTGLKNLRERYRLSFNKPLEVVDERDTFTVFLEINWQ